MNKEQLAALSKVLDMYLEQEEDNLQEFIFDGSDHTDEDGNDLTPNHIALSLRILAEYEKARCIELNITPLRDLTHVNN